MIYIDNREVPSELPLLLDGMGEPYELTQLELSDVHIYGLPVEITGEYGEVICFIFEDKSGEDFIASMLSDRLQSQLYRMSTYFKHSAVIIHGSISQSLDYSNVNRKAVLSAISGTFLKHSEDGEKGSVSLLMVDDLTDLAMLIQLIHSKLKEPLIRVNPLTLPEIEYKNPEEEHKNNQVRCLLAVTGLGEPRARSILTKMGSLQAIANAKPEDLICEGVGLTSAKKVIDFFSKKHT